MKKRFGIVNIRDEPLVAKRKSPPDVSISLYKPDTPMNGFGFPNEYKVEPIQETQSAKDEETEEKKAKIKKKEVEEASSYWDAGYIRNYYGYR